MKGRDVSDLFAVEMMILAGEAIGKWKLRLDKEDETHGLGSFANENPLRVAFRSQPKPGEPVPRIRRKTFVQLLFARPIHCLS